MTENDKYLPFPWQAESWRQLNAVTRRGASGILLYGPADIGKLALARHLARSLVCQSPTPEGHACGHCVACRWSAAGTHPDVILVRPEAIQQAEGIEMAGESPQPGADDDEGGGSERKARRAPSKEIRIEQIRVLGESLELGSHRGGSRVIVIYPAQALNLPASNALLKVLEEPPRDTLFVLVSSHAERLAATVRSRCQQIALTIPATDLALAWLESQDIDNPRELLARCGGAPLAAQAAAGAIGEQEDLHRQLVEALCVPASFSAMRSAERIAAVEPVIVVGWLLRWVFDCISCRLAQRIRYHPNESVRLAALAPRLQPERLMAYHKDLIAQRRVAEHPLNKRLFVESLLLGYSDATQGR
jgi:DNA polymerase-3 subunit delta'